MHLLRPGRLDLEQELGLPVVLPQLVLDGVAQGHVQPAIRGRAVLIGHRFLPEDTERLLHRVLDALGVWPSGRVKGAGVVAFHSVVVGQIDDAELFLAQRFLLRHDPPPSFQKYGMSIA